MRTAIIAAGLGLAAMGGGTHVRIVRLNVVTPGVEVAGAGEARWTAAWPGEPLVEAERIRTDAMAEAEVQLECGSALQLLPNSEISLPRLVLDDKGVPATTMALAAGDANFSLRAPDARDLKLALPGDVTLVLGRAADLRVEATGVNSGAVTVRRGSAVLMARGGAFKLKGKQRLAWAAGTTPVAGRFQTDSEWEAWRRNLDAGYEKALKADALASPPVFTAAGTPSAMYGAPLSTAIPAHAQSAFTLASCRDH